MSEPLIVKNGDSYNLDTRNTRKIINEIRASFGAPPTTMTDEQIEAGREVYGAKLDYDMVVIDEVQDTREKLNEELMDSCLTFADRGGHLRAFSYVSELLDRQAAITERECRKPNWDYCETCELIAERDALKAKLETYGKVPDQDECKKQQPMESGDTREQLEADVANILRNAASHTSANTGIGDMLRYTVPGSGAAPWQLEEDACEALASIVESQLAELTAELYRERKSREYAYNKLNEMYAFDGKRVKRLNELTAERNEWKSECSKLTDKIGEITNEASELMKKQPYTFDVHDVPGSLQTVGRYIDELTAERDNWANCYDLVIKREQSLLSKIDELTAEIEQLKRANRIQAQSFQKLEAELARKTLELAKAKGGTL